MDLVVKTWGKIAEQGNCAVELVHHVRKAQNGQSASYGDARGASALTDAARHVRRLMSMTYEEARNGGVDEADRWRYSREGDSKDNLAPPSRDSSWRQMISVQLDNGDNVGVPEPWEWPDPFAEITVADSQCSANGHRQGRVARGRAVQELGGNRDSRRAAIRSCPRGK